ncbi:hypothetical protein BJ138DRAFT_1057814 [Hygrophoropsis aurantiaca]|uniref:Uncharacterized protein n=1 Tax=Hygrophoropsis aurantiaca TaxID=72124 RepID=A0ACB8ANH4_9AGAM|nr:hypothetical protein BJ138DRAFT_1057814 [Hygrophoropsis aurantiaca]
MATDDQEICQILEEMSGSMASVRELIKSLHKNTRQRTSDDLDTKDGISLLSLKHHLLLSYLQSLVLLTARKAAGDSLIQRTQPSTPFSSVDREARGDALGDLVDSMIEGRVVLEKIKVLESRMRYQIEKLVRIADEPTSNQNVTNDPLAFRPNPQNLMDNEAQDSGEEGERHEGVEDRDGIYRPPKLAPMPYTETSSSKRSKRQPIPKALSSLLHHDPSRPHMESTSGLGSTPALASDRAREIARMTEFEEENFTRLVMKKKDAKRRKADEEDLALGGSGASQGRRRGRGLADEFEDVLKAVGRTKNRGIGDGYEELRKRGKKADVLVRARTRGREEFESGDDGGSRIKKKTRFETERNALGRRLAKGKKK